MVKLIKNFNKTIMLAVCLSAAAAVGVTYLRKYYLEKNAPIIYLIIAGSAYLTEIFLLYYSFSYTNLTIMYTLWNAVQNSFIPIIGIMLFKEKINKIGWVGIILTIIGGLLVGLE